MVIFLTIILIATFSSLASTTAAIFAYATITAIGKMTQFTNKTAISNA